MSGRKAEWEVRVEFDREVDSLCLKLVARNQ